MKLLHRRLEKDAAGSIKLVCEEQEDMWHVYNLIAIGDEVTATSFRKIQKESSTGSTTANKVKLHLTITVESIDFDTASCELRLKGRNTTENEFVKLGQYHTIELALQRSFTITKPVWDTIYLERIETACDARNSAEVAAVVMQQGLAHVCLMTQHMTMIRQKIEVSIARKRMGSTSTHDKGFRRFFESILQAIRHHINFEVVKCILIASPGFIKDDFMKFMMTEAQSQGFKEILDNKSKFLVCHSSSGYKHALKEILADSSVASRIESTKAYSEVRALDAFFEMMNEDSDRAYYGYNHVVRANEEKAVDTLLVTDDLFRSSDIQTRALYVKLVESVRENAGSVKIFSALHPAGEQLSQLSGVAAILRFPLPENDLGDHKHDTKNDSDDEDDIKQPTISSISQETSRISISSQPSTPLHRQDSAASTISTTSATSNPSTSRTEHEDDGDDLL